MNKPVAWMSPDGKVSNTEGKLFYIPLYTHPAELTDEEIQELANIHLAYQIEDSRVSGVFDFAKAILRKAQEK